MRRILAEIAEAEAAPSGSHGTARGMLRVTAPTQFGRLHLGPALPASSIATRRSSSSWSTGW